MVALVSSPYPIATFFTLNKPQTRPRIPLTRCSIRVSSSLPSRRIRIRRKNSLRPKILKTLTKPYVDTIPEDLGTRIEPNDYGVVEELEASVGVNENGLGEVQVVRDVRGTNVMGFPGQIVFKVVVSFVGLFLLQTIVSVWIMGSPASADKARTDGRVLVGDSGLTSIDELKIAEIRRMVRMVKEDEKRKKNMEKGEGELEDESDDDDDDDEEEEEEEEEKPVTDNSLRNGIAKEVDGRLTMLRKRSPMGVQSVNFLKKAGSSGKDVGNENVVGKEEYNRLMFEAKRKFRSQVTEVGNKPKGFEGNNHVREKDMNGTESERSNLRMTKDEKSVSQSSEPLQSFKKAAATEEENLDKGINGSSSLRNDSLINNLSVGMNKNAKPENDILQDSITRITLKDGAKPKEPSVIEIQESRRKKNDLKSSTSTMHTMPRRNEQSGSRKLKSKLSRRTNKDKKKTDAQKLWWSTLPCVFAILMQKGLGSEAQQGFYTLHINSDADYESSYTVAFEDQSDARNFSYILDSVFGDLPDAAVDVVMMSTQEFKEMVKSVNKKVVVARKGEVKLYAGQPLEEAESVLRLLVK